MDLYSLSAVLPADISFVSVIKLITIAAVVTTAFSLIFRFLFGKGSALNKAICAGIGVLCIYILTIVIYTFSPGNLECFLVPLPFVKFSDTYLHLMDFTFTDFSVICSQILSMIILVLMYNLADAILPDGESTSPISWFLLRYLTIIAAMVIHYFVSGLTDAFLPDLLVSYGPTILLLCLVASLLMGALGFILGLVLTVVNPIFGILFSFFFSNKFGKQLSKAMITSVLLTTLVAILDYFGYGIISIDISSLVSYIPLLAALMGLWYIIGRKL